MKHPTKFELPKDLILVVSDIGVHGGKHIKRLVEKTEIEGKLRTVSAKVDTTVVDVKARDYAEELAGRATNTAKSECQLTPIGYCTTKDTATQIEREIALLHQEAERFNEMNTGVRVTVDVHMIEVSGALDAHTVNAIADKIRSSLTQIKTLILAGEPTPLKNALQRCANLHQLAVGVQAESIKFALESATSAHYVLKEALKGGATEDALIAAAATFDLDTIDGAIIMFMPLAS